MKKLLLVLVVLLASCEMPEQQDPSPVISKPVVVKKKYSENSVTKDLVFGTGNWHSTNYYIIDENNKVWRNFRKEDYILCDVGDTLWTDDGYWLQINKK